jgi:hypothetical protein
MVAAAAAAAATCLQALSWLMGFLLVLLRVAMAALR